MVNGHLGGEFSEIDNDISFVSSGRPSVDCMSSSPYDIIDSGRNSRISISSEQSLGSVRYGTKFSDNNSSHEFSMVSHESGRTSCSSENMVKIHLVQHVHINKRCINIDTNIRLSMHVLKYKAVK